MPALSNYLRNQLIDTLFRTGTLTTPTTLYLALCTNMPSAASTGSTITEPSGNYFRQSIPTGTQSWYSTQGDTGTVSTGTTGATGNVTAISWTNVSWTATLQAVALVDSSTVGQGNLLWFSNLGANQAVIAGDNLQFAANTFKPSFS